MERRGLMSKRHVVRFVWAVSLLAAMSTAFAQGAAPAVSGDAQQRADIRSARQAAEARFKQAEAACRERFVVTPCIDDAKGERRRTLASLRERELKLDELERRQRASAREQAVLRKQSELEAAASAAASASAARGAASVPRTLSKPSARASDAAAITPRPPLDATAEQAAERAERSAQRQKQAEERRARIEARQAEREKDKLKRGEAGAARSAPLPGAASAPR